jgi:hypothetical protein
MCVYLMSRFVACPFTRGETVEASQHADLYKSCTWKCGIIFWDNLLCTKLNNKMMHFIHVHIILPNRFIRLHSTTTRPDNALTWNSSHVTITTKSTTSLPQLQHTYYYLKIVLSIPSIGSYTRNGTHRPLRKISW